MARFLRSFQVLLRSSRLYQKNHPRVMENLETCEHHLRSAFELLPAITVGVERGHLRVPSLSPGAAARALTDPRGKLAILAEELAQCGISSLAFLPQAHLGEIDTLAHLVNQTIRHPGVAAEELAREWPAQIERHALCGISVNAPLERKVDTALASLLAALMAYGSATQAAGPSASERAPEEADAWALSLRPAASLERMIGALRLLAGMIPILQQADRLPPQETAGAFHTALAAADPQAVSRVIAAITSKLPRDAEGPEAYMGRLVDGLLLELVTQEFRAERVAPADVPAMFDRLAGELAAAGGPLAHFKRAGAAATASGRHEPSRLFVRWADDAYPVGMCERFWAELPAGEKSRVLRSPDAWCVPVSALRALLEELTAAQPDARGGEPLHEARQILLNYSRGLESEHGQARRAVASGLVELHPLFEQTWPHQLPPELSRVILGALEHETSPGIAGLLAALTENLARLAAAKADYAEFEHILLSLENAPRDTEHAHRLALAQRLIADERWLLLIDASLENRPLDPALPRLLRRDPERLLDRLGLLLTEPDGLESLPAMARLLRAVGEPALGVLEMRLFEPRRQRATTAVKLLAATQPERLVAALPRALPSWDWGLQDLAVSELARTDTPGTAWAFLATVTEAHPLVAPMMLDQIGMAGDASAVPLLISIAAGENEHLRDIFIRIKAIEALGRLEAVEAADVLRAMLRQRNGLTHAEPAGLRAAAEEALALIENHPSSARLRAAQEALERASTAYSRPRRYTRIPLAVPMSAQFEGPHSGTARVRTISLGGAFLESNRRLSVGDSIHVEIQTGLRRIRSTAVVRNVSPRGGGVEFVHMKHEDREKLRKLLRRLQHD